MEKGLCLKLLLVLAVTAAILELTYAAHSRQRHREHDHQHDQDDDGTDEDVDDSDSHSHKKSSSKSKVKAAKTKSNKLESGKSKTDQLKDEDKVESNRHVCEMAQDNGRKEGCNNKGERKGKWFYNCDTHKCKRFEYEGCDGNDNNFDTEEDCAEKCIGNKKSKWCTPAKEDEKKQGENILRKLVEQLGGSGGGGAKKPSK